MNTIELLLLIIIVLSVISIITTSFLFYYKKKYDDLDFKLICKNIKMNDMQCLIDKLKESEKVFKIEKVVMTPKEITCKFEISNRLALVDAECLKRHAFDALADYIIKEYDNNPTLFNIQQSQNPLTNSTNFTLNVRLLPYPEQSDTFETICKEMEEHGKEIPDVYK